MKKLIITMLLCFIVFITNAQFISKYAVVGINNGNQYDWSKPKPTYLKINVKGNHISISNENESVYTTSDLILDNPSKKEVSWNATDEKNKKCVVKLKTYDNEEVMLYIFYDNVAFGYYLTKPIRLDSL